jgi:hypothetical protein
MRRLGKKPMLRRAILLLSAGVTLSCLGIFLSLPQTTAYGVPEVPAAPVGEDGGPNAPPPDESHPLRAAAERQKKDELPENASLLTMLVLAMPSFGGSVLWLLATKARTQEAIRFWALEGGDRRWLAAPEGHSFLGVFRL